MGSLRITRIWKGEEYLDFMKETLIRLSILGTAVQEILTNRQEGKVKH